MKELISEFRKFFKYLSFGVINTTVSYVLIIVLVQLVGIRILYSNIIGYTVGLILSYVLNKNFTFKVQTSKVDWVIIKFCIVVLVSFYVQYLAMTYVFMKIGWGYKISQLFAIIVYTSLSYLGHRIFTFRQEGLTGDL